MDWDLAESAKESGAYRPAFRGHTSRAGDYSECLIRTLAKQPTAMVHMHLPRLAFSQRDHIVCNDATA